MTRPTKQLLHAPDPKNCSLSDDPDKICCLCIALNVQAYWHVEFLTSETPSDILRMYGLFCLAEQGRL